MALDEKEAYIAVKLGHLAVQRDRDRFIRSLIEICMHAVDAERATVYFVDRARNELHARIFQRPGFGTDIRLPIGAGISGTVALTGETVNVPDAYADARFDRTVDVRSGFRTRNMLVVPVSGPDGTITGIIQVLNKREGSFERQDQMLLERIAGAVAPAIARMPASVS